MGKQTTHPRARAQNELYLFAPDERIELDDASPIPLYHQMEKVILDRIGQKKAIGWMLPRETDLARIFGVSRATITRVKDNLLANGLIRSRKRAGTRIVRLNVIEDLARLISYSEQMRAKGLNVRTKIIEVKHAKPTVPAQKKLGLKEGNNVLRVRRLRGTKGVFPVVLLRSELHERLGLTPDLDYTGSLYDLIEAQMGVPIDYADEQIFAANATAFEAKLLGIGPGDTVLVMERLTMARGDIPIEFVRAVYRPEHYTFSIRLRR